MQNKLSIGFINSIILKYEICIQLIKLLQYGIKVVFGSYNKF